MTQEDALLIDAGTGNLRSVHKAIQSLGINVRVTSDPQDLRSGARILLPGVGAFGSFMEGLRARGLIEPLREAARRGDPFLGICVGMQALFDRSQELGEYDGLGLLAGQVVRFDDLSGRKVPHTGWNQLWFTDCLLFRGLHKGDYAYFNHSYYCANALPSDRAASTDYGQEFTSAVQRENIFGVQFHPEKSQQVGLTVLQNFVKG